MAIEAQFFSYDSPLSRLYLTVSDQKVIKLEYEPEVVGIFNRQLVDGDIKTWLDKYFSGKRPQNTLTIHMQGTEFQKKVWNAMLSIPYGETRTYGEVSKAIQSAPRAVGQACKRNHIPILIPCHRIVAMHSVGGYEGSTTGQQINRKHWLLDHEKSV